MVWVEFLLCQVLIQQPFPTSCLHAGEHQLSHRTVAHFLHLPKAVSHSGRPGHLSYRTKDPTNFYKSPNKLKQFRVNQDVIYVFCILYIHETWKTMFHQQWQLKIKLRIRIPYQNYGIFFWWSLFHYNLASSKILLTMLPVASGVSSHERNNLCKNSEHQHDSAVYLTSNIQRTPQASTFLRVHTWFSGMWRVSKVSLLIFVEVAPKKHQQNQKNSSPIFPTFFFPSFVLVRSSQVHCIYSSHSCMAVHLHSRFGRMFRKFRLGNFGRH